MTAGGAGPSRWRDLPPRFGFGAHSTRRALRVLWQAAWRVSAALSLTVLLLTLVRGAAVPLWLLAMGAVVDRFVHDPDRLPLALGLLVLVSLAQSVVPVLARPFTNELGRRVDLHFRQRMMRSVSAPHGVAHLEDPHVQDLISTAEGIASQGGSPGSSLSGYLNLVALKVTGLGSVVLLAQYRWWLGPGVALGAMLIRRRILTIWFRTAEALQGDVAGLRRARYLRDLVLRPEAAKENRLFGLGRWLADRHDREWNTAMAPVWRRRRSIAWQMLVTDLAVVVLAGAAAVPVMLGLVAGTLDAARAIVLGGALSAIVALGGFLPDADFPIRYGFLTLPALLEVEERVSGTATSSSDGAAGPAPATGRPRDQVRFEAVSFRYPGTEPAVLDRLDLTIRAGTSVALVGANGAGKTTMIKLLARLYDPVRGSIQVDGTDLRAMDIDQWRRQLAVVFQDFARYELSARDNVGFGALELRHDDAALDEVAERAGVLAALRAAPRGWESPLSRSYRGGADLSGGQWQRIALARVLLAIRNGAQLLVLDEPTANLDVRAEAEFYDRFLTLAAGRTTILISHRFSTVRRADRICVIADGRICEDGSHDELLALGGTYARMFTLQAARFVDA